MTISLVRPFMTSIPRSLPTSLGIYAANLYRSNFSSTKDSQSAKETAIKTSAFSDAFRPNTTGQGLVFQGVREKDNLRDLRDTIQYHFITKLNTKGTFIIGLPRNSDDFSIEGGDWAVPRNIVSLATFKKLSQEILDRGFSISLQENYLINLAPDVYRPGFLLTISLPDSSLEYNDNTVQKASNGFNPSFIPSIVHQRIEEKTTLAYKSAAAYIEHELSKHADVRKYSFFLQASNCPPGQESFLQSRLVKDLRDKGFIASANTVYQTENKGYRMKIVVEHPG